MAENLQMNSRLQMYNNSLIHNRLSLSLNKSHSKFLLNLLQHLLSQRLYHLKKS